MHIYTPEQDRGSGITLYDRLRPGSHAYPADVERLIAHADWWAQPALGGRRVLILKAGHAVTGTDPAGLAVPLPAAVVEAVLQVPADRCRLDGHLVGDVFHCTDLLARGDADLRGEPYAARYDAALDLVDAVPLDALRYAETAVTAAGKRRLADRLRAAGAVGVVFRHRRARFAADGAHVELAFAAAQA